MNSNPIAWYDHYESSRIRKIYTYQEHRIPGLRMIGYHNTPHAMASLKPHYHKDCFEFSYVVQGNVQFSVNEKDYHVSGGEMFLTFPNEVHSTGDMPMSLHQMYWFQLDISDPTHFLFLDPKIASSLIDRLFQLPCRVLAMKGDTEASLSEVFSNISTGSELNRMQAGITLASFLCRILKQVDAPISQATADIARAKEYILNHICDEISMEELSKLTLLSVSRFKQKFKDQIGTSPRNFINFHKIEAAKEMLLEGHTVTDTAMELGFSNSNYFSAVFRRYTCLSPTEYILQLSQGRQSS